MAQEMIANIQRNKLSTVFQSGFHRYHSPMVAVLKITEDNRLYMDDGRLTVLLLLDFSLRHFIWLFIGCY
jgi:hypothetical protein